MWAGNWARLRSLLVGAGVLVFLIVGLTPWVLAEPDPRCDVRPDHPKCQTTTTEPASTTLPPSTTVPPSTTTVPPSTTTAPPSTTTTVPPSTTTVPPSTTTTTTPPTTTIPPGGACLIVIDEDSIDGTTSTILAAAATHGVSADALVNGDNPGVDGNPWLTWSTDFAGDVAVLPTGIVGDEGWFALPADAPWSLQDFVDGVVPQTDLASVGGLMPIRNQDLATMIGMTCVAVVYDADVTMAYEPITANLQGNRNGLFAFTILEVQLPGTIAESQEGTSLYDVVIEVDGPTGWTDRFAITVRDHEPDVIRLGARYNDNTSFSLIVAESDFEPDAVMTVTIEGFVFEDAMPWDVDHDRYEYIVDTGGVVLHGLVISIQTDEGGVDNGVVE